MKFNSTRNTNRYPNNNPLDIIHTDQSILIADDENKKIETESDLFKPIDKSLTDSLHKQNSKESVKELLSIKLNEKELQNDISLKNKKKVSKFKILEKSSSKEFNNNQIKLDINKDGTEKKININKITENVKIETLEDFEKMTEKSNSHQIYTPSCEKFELNKDFPKIDQNKLISISNTFVTSKQTSQENNLSKGFNYIIPKSEFDSFSKERSQKIQQNKTHFTNNRQDKNINSNLDQNKNLNEDINKTKTDHLMDEFNRSNSNDNMIKINKTIISNNKITFTSDQVDNNSIIKSIKALSRKGSVNITKSPNNSDSFKHINNYSSMLNEINIRDLKLNRKSHNSQPRNSSPQFEQEYGFKVNNNSHNTDHTFVKPTKNNFRNTIGSIQPTKTSSIQSKRKSIKLNVDKRKNKFIKLLEKQHSQKNKKRIQSVEPIKNNNLISYDTNFLSNYKNSIQFKANKKEINKKKDDFVYQFDAPTSRSKSSKKNILKYLNNNILCLIHNKPANKICYDCSSINFLKCSECNQNCHSNIFPIDYVLNTSHTSK